MTESELSFFRDILGMPGASLLQMCERIRALRENETAILRLIECCPRAFLSKPTAEVDMLARFRRRHPSSEGKGTTG